MNDSNDTPFSPSPAAGEKFAPSALPLTRRKFLRAASVGTAAVTFGPKSAWAQKPSDQLNLALVGLGAQGSALTSAIHPTVAQGRVRFAAFSDINQQALTDKANSFEKLAPENGAINRYTRIEELLEKETSLDGVLIAVPDLYHEPYTSLVLRAGTHAYCEKMMSNSIEAARKMVEAQKETGKLCQIGHQRRSNPRYLRLKAEIVGAADGTAANPTGKSLLGQITGAYAQWNRAVTPPMRLSRRYQLPPEVLAEYGYESNDHLANWRWYRKYGGGPISDLGAHQIDLFNWLLGTTPVAITATGGRDYYDGESFMPDGTTQRAAFEFEDNVNITYEYQVNGKVVRCLYTVLTTTSTQGVFEKFFGDQGSVVISEDLKNNQVYRETAAQWDGDSLIEAGILAGIPGAVHHKFWESPKPWWQTDKWLTKVGVKAGAVDARESKPTGAYELPEVLNSKPHAPHLVNFIDCVQNGKSQTDLNCPVAEAFKCAVIVLKSHQAIEERRTITFDPAEFTV